jgi:hypothetical protein
MRRLVAAFAVAALCVLGVTGASSVPVHELPSSGAASVREATSVVRVAAAPVSVPQLVLPPLTALAVLVAAAAIGALALDYLARQRRRALVVPILTTTVRRRGPPAARVHH